MPPPPIPPSKPPPVPGQHRKVATIVYGVFSLLFILPWRFWRMNEEC